MFTQIFRAFPFVALLIGQPAWAGTVEVEMIYPPDAGHAHHAHHGMLDQAEAVSQQSMLAMADSGASEPMQSEGEFTQVDQLINAEADNPLDMFKFSPDYVEIEPGDTIRFMNSLGQHTVVSIKGMLPEGAEPFSISHQKVAEVRFDQPGIYGIRCKVHSRYGMVMLVKVGDDLPNLEKARSKRQYRKAGKRFKMLFERLDKSIAAGG